MPSGVLWRKFGDRAGVPAASLRACFSGAALAAALCVVALGGCAPIATVQQGAKSSAPHAAPRPVRTAQREPIPLPDQALLAPQPAPDCAFRGPVSNPSTAEETRMKLDYEQQCYRQAESLARGRLQQLQDSVQETIKAANSR